MSGLCSSPVPPLDDEDLLQEILLRLPPLPSSLPRASTICKRWYSILSDPRFLYRFRKHHRKPPLIGFFDKEIGRAPVFTPIMDRPNRIPVSFALPKNLLDCTAWANLLIHVSYFFGCRHGIALFLDRPRHEAVLWDPYTNFQRRVVYPPGFDNPQAIGFDNQHDNNIKSAAVLCSAGDQQHVHGDCRLSPFKLVLACHDTEITKAFVCIYESKYGIWEDTISIATTNVISRNRPSLLVRNTLYWLFHGHGILVFDFERLTLEVIEKPASVDVTNTYGIDWSFQIVQGEDNGLGLAVLLKPELSLQLWARKADYGGVVSWVLQKTVQLDELFTRPLRSGAVKLVLMPGYDEDTNVIFLSSVSHDFMLQLESMQFKYIGRREYMSSRFYYPYKNLYTAGRRIAGGDGVAENVNA